MRRDKNVLLGAPSGKDAACVEGLQRMAFELNRTQALVKRALVWAACGPCGAHQPELPVPDTHLNE